MNDDMKKSRTEPSANAHETPRKKAVLFGVVFVVLFIISHFITPLFSLLPWSLLPEEITIFGMIPINGRYFFGLLGGGAIAYLIAYRWQLFMKLSKTVGLFLACFFLIFITLHFVLPGMPSTLLETFPETIYLFNATIRSIYFFGFVFSVGLTILLMFYPSKLKTALKFLFSFWGFKAILSIVDILIFRNLLRASDADVFTMWTIPLLFAFLTNFLPFFFAVAYKTHQERLEDKRMRRASRTFILLTSVLLLVAAWLITNQRILQMNQSLHMSLAHFEDMGPHTISIEGMSYFIDNPPLDELSPLAFLGNHWHLSETNQPIYGRYPGFLIDFTLLILPILLIFVTMLASYFNVSANISNKWYDMLESLTDRKKKNLKIAHAEVLAAQQTYENARLAYDTLDNERESYMRKLEVLLMAEKNTLTKDVKDYEYAVRNAILKGAIMTVINSYDTHLYHLDAWLMSDIESFKTKMATSITDENIQKAILAIDINQLITDYNQNVEPIKQFDTPAKTEALMNRLKAMNGITEEGVKDNE